MIFVQRRILIHWNADLIVLLDFGFPFVSSFSFLFSLSAEAQINPALLYYDLRCVMDAAEAISKGMIRIGLLSSKMLWFRSSDHIV
jgi:hypothetical protein